MSKGAPSLSPALPRAPFFFFMLGYGHRGAQTDPDASARSEYATEIKTVLMSQMSKGAPSLSSALPRAPFFFIMLGYGYGGAQTDASARSECATEIKTVSMNQMSKGAPSLSSALPRAPFFFIMLGCGYRGAQTCPDPSARSEYATETRTVSMSWMSKGAPSQLLPTPCARAFACLGAYVRWKLRLSMSRICKGRLDNSCLRPACRDHARRFNLRLMEADTSG
jgi:hypothetical protein